MKIAILDFNSMPLSQARELLDIPNSNLNDLLDCLVSLAKDYGHIEGAQRMGFRDSASATENLLEIQIYLDKIKNRIIYLLQKT